VPLRNELLKMFLNCLEEQGCKTDWLSPDPTRWQQQCAQLIVDHSLQGMTQKYQDRCFPWRAMPVKDGLNIPVSWPSGCSCFVWLWWPVFSDHMLASLLVNMPRVHLRMFKIGVRPCSSEKGMCGHLIAEFGVCWHLADVAVRMVSPFNSFSTRTADEILFHLPTCSYWSKPSSDDIITLMGWRHEADEIYLILCFYLSWFSRIFDENSPMKVKSHACWPCSSWEMKLLVPSSTVRPVLSKIQILPRDKRSYWWHMCRMRYILSATIWYWKS